MVGRSGDAPLLATIAADLATKEPGSATVALLTSLREGITRAKGDWRAFASDTRWSALTDRASQSLTNPSSPIAARVSAVHVLSLLPTGESQDLFRTVLLEEKTEPALAAALVGAITDLDFLIARFATLQSARDELASRILANAKSSTAFLTAIRDGKIKLADAPASLIENLRRHADAAVESLAGEVLPPVVSRADVIAAYQPALAKKGNAEKGKAAFAKVCIACHVSYEGLGMSLGNIIDPNREVAPQYQAYTFEFTSGPPATGFIVSENSTEVTLRQPGGVDRTFPRSEVASMKGLGQSLMPEGLEATLTVGEMTDLIAYILKTP
jgi:putative heme-binding domain-containing protein